MPNEFTPFALVADDDALIRMDAEDILQKAGFRVFEAAGVDAAVAILEEHAESIQLLFTDVHMPPGKLTGFDLATTCAARWPHIGILVASGMAVANEGDLPEKAVFIRKPFSADVVYARLQELLPDGAKPEPLVTAAYGRNGATS